MLVVLSDVVEDVIQDELDGVSLVYLEERLFATHVAVLGGRRFNDDLFRITKPSITLINYAQIWDV